MIFRRYPVKCVIISPRSDGFRVSFDKAGRKRDRRTGHEWYRLKKARKNIKPVAFKNITAQNYAVLCHAASGDYIPMDVNFAGNPHLKVLDEDMKQWLITQQQRIALRFQTKKNLLDKLLPVILVALFGVAIMLIFIGYGEMMKVIMGEANEFAAIMKQITEALAGITGTIKPP